MIMRPIRNTSDLFRTMTPANGLPFAFLPVAASMQQTAAMSLAYRQAFATAVMIVAQNPVTRMHARLKNPNLN
jgi:hypothetical protein